MAEHISYTAGMAKGKQLLAINIVYTTGEFQAAIQYALPSVALWRELERPFELATALNLLGADLSEIHEYAAGETGIARMPGYLSIARLPARRCPAMQNLGGIAQVMGDYARARALFCEALRIRRHLGLQRGYAYSFE